MPKIPALGDAILPLSGADFIVVSQAGAAKKMPAIDYVDAVSTTATALTAAELKAIRKAKQQAERARIADLTSRINRFVSSANGSDSQPGRAMSRAKASVAGLIASLDYGIVDVTPAGTLTGGNPGTYRATTAGGTPIRAARVELLVTAAGALSAGQNGWTRAVDPGDYAEGSAVPALAIPAAAGLALANLTATLGRVEPQGSVIGFECGNIFTEQMVARRSGTIICSYPKGNSRRQPYFDCTKAAGPWVNVAGNIWETTLARAPDFETVGGEDNYSLFLRNDVANPGHNDTWLTRKPTAIVEGDPGLTYNIPQAQLYAESNPVCTVRLRAPTGVDPNTLAIRQNYRTQGALGRYRLNNYTVDGFAGGGHLSAQGVVNAGTNFTGCRLFFTNGGKHDLVAESGNIFGGVSWNTELVSNRILAFAGSGHDCIQLTMYRDDPTGLSFKIQHYWAIQPVGVWNAGYFYSHASGPKIYDEGLIEGGGANNGGGVKGIYAKRQILRGMYQKDLRGAAATPAAMASAMAADPTLIAHYEQTHGLYTADAALGSVSSATALTTGINAGGEVWIDNRSEIVIKHNGYHNFHDQVLGQGWASLTTSVIQKVDFSYNMAYMKGRYTFLSGTKPLAVGSAGSHHNILVRDFANIGSFITWVNFAATFTGYHDYNIYIDLKANTNLRWRYGATNYTFAAWKALGFWDQNSVVLNAAQAETLFLHGVAGYLAGDHRLNPACALTFVDGTPIVTGGIQEYYHHDAREYVAGQPPQWPTIPTTGAECAEFGFNPYDWQYLAAA